MAVADFPGAEAEAAWSAPGRVNLIGEHTDYNGGLVLPVAIDLRATAVVRPRRDDQLRLSSRQHPDQPVEVALPDVRHGVPGGWAAYVAGVMAVMGAAGHEVGGADILVDSNVPEGAGLSSSAALECAVAAAVADAFALDVTPRQLAALAQQAENDVVGVPCGPMDQVVSMLGRPSTALLLDCASGDASHVPFPPHEHGLDLVVADTRVRHALADGQYAERRRLCERAARLLGVRLLSELSVADLDAALTALPDDQLRAVCRHVVTENARVREAVDALGRGDLRRLGPLFASSHASLRDDYRVSCAELDLAVDLLLVSGAVAARMTGAGFGGSVVGLLPKGGAPNAARALADAFTGRGLLPPLVRVVTPADGARRESAR